MNKTFFYPQAFGRVFVIFAVLAVLFAAFLLTNIKKAHAADAGEFVYFRIDTELNVVHNKGVTVEWSCNGTASGSVLDNTASESTQALDGTVIIASASTEMTTATCVFGTSDTISAKVSLGGWVTRRWTESLPASGAAVFTTRASMDYNLVVNGVEDELGTVITLNGTAASTSWNYTGTTASQSYSGGKRYIAVSAAGSSTLIGGADGYVNKRASVSFSDFTTSSTSADFDDGQTSSVNGTPLPFSTKATLTGYSPRTGQTTAITTATVTAGDSGGTSCTASSNSYYCAVPIGHTGTTATATNTGLTNPSATTCTYTDRDDGADVQSTCSINAVEAGGVGSGDGGTTPTPTPTPIPDVSVSPTPTPTTTPTPGVTPSITPTPSASPTPAVTYELYRKVNDPKVYVKGSDGTLTWVKTLADFNAAGYKWSDVKLISGSEFAKMRVGGQLRVVKNIKFLRVRESNSTRSKILGQVLPGQVLQFYEWNNGWYKIKKTDGSFGWVFGGYVGEI